VKPPRSISAAVAQRVIEPLVHTQGADFTHAGDPIAPDAERDGKRRIAHTRVHALSTQTGCHLSSDLLYITGAGAGFHQQPAEFQRHHCDLLQRLAPKRGLEEFCFHNSFATISTKRILMIVMPGKIMA